MLKALTNKLLGRPIKAHVYAALRYLLRGGFRRKRDDEAVVMHNVIDAIQEVKGRFAEQICCIETGTIRSYDDKHESTRHIADALGSRGHLISVDINPDSIRISKDICKDRTNIEWILASSTDYLKRLQNERFHFALLDSANDKDLIFSEFTLLIPHMAEDSIVIIDDAGIIPNGQRKDRLDLAEKGHRIWEFLITHDVPFKVLLTTIGHGTQLRIDLNKLNKKRIEQALSRRTGK